MHRSISCADFTFPLLTHDRALTLIAMLDIQGVDLGLFAGRSHLDITSELSTPEASGNHLRARLDAIGLQPSDVFLQLAGDFESLAVNHPIETRRQQARQSFLECLNYTNALGCRHMTILPGVHHSCETLHDSWRRACDELAWRVEQSHAAGIPLGVEPHLGSLAATPKLARELIESVPGLTLTLDYAHFVAQGISQDEINPLLGCSSHFHARCARKGRLQASLDQSEIDFARVCNQMDRYEYSGAICLEYVWIAWEHCNEIDTLSETILLHELMREHHAF